MNSSDSVQGARANLSAWLTAFNNKDMNAFMTLYDNEVVYANAQAPLMQGLAEIQQWFERTFEKTKGVLLFN